jgi:hypothetical protein
MNERHCPKCKATLYSADHFFCSSCGEQLDKELVSPGESVVRTMALDEGDEKKVSFNKHVLPALTRVAEIINLKEILFVSFLLVLIGMPTYIWLKNINYVIPVLQGNISQQDIISNYVISTDIKIKSQNFGADSIADYIPENVEIYVEGQDLQFFTNLFSQYDGGFKEIFKDVVPFSDSHFGAYSKKDNEGNYYWTLLVFPDGGQFENIKIDNSKYPWLKIGRADKAIIISMHDEIKSVQDAKEKITRSLSLDPDFVRFTSEIPKSGKLLIYSSKSKTKDYILGFLKKDIPKEGKDILTLYKNYNYINVVIK